jgi:hypothetical protein
MGEVFRNRVAGAGTIRRLTRAARLALVLTLVGCGGRGDSTAPTVELTVSDVYEGGGTTCDFEYHCSMTVGYVTSNVATGENIPGEVTISGHGTYPATSTSGSLGKGQFTWTLPTEPGSYQIRVCPNVPSPIDSRCRSMTVSLGDNQP